MAKRGTDPEQTVDEAASPAAKTRISRRRLQTRSRLLQAAYQVMSTKGVDAATIQEITDCAQVGFGTFYNYFKSKDEVAACLLDCIIQDMARRNELATESFKLTDPARVMPVSWRLTLRAAIKDPFWRWWVLRPDLLSDRVRRAFEPYGTRDMRLAIKAGRYSVQDSAVEATWGIMIWIVVGGLCDVISGRYPEDHERYVVEMITRVAGASASQARELVADPLPVYPPANIDFSFDLTQRGLAPEE